jgi:hypothetical protein
MQISLQACGVADADRIRPLLRGSSPSHLGLEVFGAAANISSVLAIVRRNRSCGRGRLERSDVGPCCGQAAGRGLLKRPRTVTFQFRTKAPVPQGVSYSNQLSSGLPLCQARSRLWTHHSMIRYFPGAVQLHQGRFLLFISQGRGHSPPNYKSSVVSLHIFARAPPCAPAPDQPTSEREADRQCRNEVGWVEGSRGDFDPAARF